MSKQVEPNENVTPEMAEELTRINKMNSGHVDESDPEPKAEDKEPKDPKDPKPSADKTPPPTKQDDPEPKAPEKPATPPAKEPEKDPKPKEPAKPDDDDDEDDDDEGKDPVDPKPTRPVKYIPIPKYKSEKAEWEKKVADRDAELARLSKELELSKGQKQDLKDAKTAEDLEAFITENELDDDAAKIVRGLATVLEKRTEAKIPKVDLTNLQRAEKEAAERKEKEYFDNEFKGLAPAIKKHFGDLTPEQEAKVREKLDALAHTKELHQTPLHYILAGNVDELTELIKGEKPADPDPAPKGRRTAESSKPGQGKHIQLDNAYFKDKKDFKELETLDAASRKELISSFDPDTYVRYVGWVGQQDTGVEVSRNGRKIILK